MAILLPSADARHKARKQSTRARSAVVQPGRLPGNALAVKGTFHLGRSVDNRPEALRYWRIADSPADIAA
jgi:hypothetical protein